MFYFSFSLFTWGSLAIKPLLAFLHNLFAFIATGFLRVLFSASDVHLANPLHLHLLYHISLIGKATKALFYWFLTIHQFTCSTDLPIISSSLALLLKSTSFPSLTGIPEGAKNYHWAETIFLLRLKEMSYPFITLIACFFSFCFWKWLVPLTDQPVCLV